MCGSGVGGRQLNTCRSLFETVHSWGEAARERKHWSAFKLRASDGASLAMHQPHACTVTGERPVPLFCGSTTGVARFRLPHASHKTQRAHSHAAEHFSSPQVRARRVRVDKRLGLGARGNASSSATPLRQTLFRRRRKCAKQKSKMSTTALSLCAYEPIARE